MRILRCVWEEEAVLPAGKWLKFNTCFERIESSVIDLVSSQPQVCRLLLACTCGMFGRDKSTLCQPVVVKSLT